MAEARDTFRALGNETRLQIMRWLRDPGAYFPPQEYQAGDASDWSLGVCVDSIRQLAGVSQSTMSHYLDVLQRAGLLVAERRGRWTYYRRDEDALRRLADYVAYEL